MARKFGTELLADPKGTFAAAVSLLDRAEGLCRGESGSDAAALCAALDHGRRDQSLMMAFGMVVIAGIVGSGGLGETIYGAIRTLDIATSINASIAIVVLTMVLDRVTQSLARTK
ncbi:hypothetical protein [Paracoccus sp. N5]|uniref:hypothetical protein n=1 Tax=Paracoccus sp. N5 TaxID=1101189 RepID=UPI00039A105D|nr:hypothetical protein [Paracoccus sp. N5]